MVSKRVRKEIATAWGFVEEGKVQERWREGNASGNAKGNAGRSAKRLVAY